MSEGIVIFCMHVYEHNTTTELNQNLTKSIPRMCSIRGIYTKEKYLCKNLRCKEGGGHLLKGCVFSGTYGTCIKVCLLNEMGLGYNSTHTPTVLIQNCFDY